MYILTFGAMIIWDVVFTGSVLIVVNRLVKTVDTGKASSINLNNDYWLCRDTGLILAFMFSIFPMVDALFNGINPSWFSNVIPSGHYVSQIYFWSERISMAMFIVIVYFCGVIFRLPAKREKREAKFAFGH